MRHFPSDKYNVAWFKLAECVARGEKERALAVYRLLSHSLDDRALARQLEGDLLWSFNDEQAVEKYHEAAALYQKDQRNVQAAALYEHVITLAPYSELYLLSLVNVYQAINNHVKLCKYSAQLIVVLLEKNKIEDAVGLLTQFEQSLDNAERTILYESLLFQLLKRAYYDKEFVITILQKALDVFSVNENKKLLTQFLARLQLVDQAYYQQACEYLAGRSF